MERWKQELKLAFLKLEKLTHKEKFLHQCIAKRLIPKGLQLNVNISAGSSTSEMLYRVNDALVSAGTTILKAVYNDVKCTLQRAKQHVDTLRNTGILQFGQTAVNRTVYQVKKHSKSICQNIPGTHSRKLAELAETTEPPFDPNKVGKGSVKVVGFPTKLDSNSKTIPLEQTTQAELEKSIHKPTHRGKRSKTQRKARQRWRQQRQRQNHYVPTEEELSRFDPIILVDNFVPTKEQIEVCRMSKATAPTPKEPIDVSDQLIGFHGFSERMRWHRHFEMEKRKQDQDPDGEEEFVKRPWYRPTTKAAPRNNPELETFLAACQRDFLEVKNRRRIRDNMRPGLRKAIKELRDLPITHGAACRYADKSAVTVITSLKEDDQIIKETLTDPRHYDQLEEDPTRQVKKKIQDWTNKWQSKAALTEDIAQYVTDIDNTHPARCKPLIKTHKKKPYPYRLLLSGSGTPVQPLSKLVQQAIAHLTDHLTYQVIDTKEFLCKIQEINLTMAPLPKDACLAVCDVVALYPSVDNAMGVPAVKLQLSKFPSPLDIPKDCIVEALEIALNNNSCEYTDGEGKRTNAAPNSGTAMGPCHACDYVDVFMGQLDEKLVAESPVPLLSSLQGQQGNKELSYLDWSRFRDDGFSILPNEERAKDFEDFLQTLHPGISWTVSCGKTKDYLDLTVSINEEGVLETDVYSKNSNSYLPPFSCHAPSVFRGVAMGIGTRLRMLVSDDRVLEQRVQEYAKYLTMSGWKWTKAIKGVRQGARRDRKQLLHDKPEKQEKKIAWITTYDPRVPSKTAIIKKNIHMLHADPNNKEIFPRGMVVAADRKRKKLGTNVHANSTKENKR